MAKQTWPKLPVKFKEKWVTALRNGEYKQGKDKLINTSGHFKQYCCLGVACEMTGSKVYKNAYFISKRSKKIIGIPEILKGEVNKNNNDCNPLAHKLATMNDEGKSFKFIANWIEKNL